MNQPIDYESQFSERLKKLNKNQKKAVETIEGPLLVVAGPGSGKTEILSMHVAEILRKTQARPSNILCLTFTDAAAQNMRERLTKLIGDRAYQVSIHTFHNFSVDIIRNHGEFFYHGATFSPADPVIKMSLLQNIFNEMSHDNPLRSFHPEEGFVYLRPVQMAIEYIKRAGLKPEELEEILNDNLNGIKLINEILLPTLSEKVGKDSIRKIRQKLKEFTDKASKRSGRLKGDIYHPIEEAIALSLTEAIAKAEKEEKNEALSKWKTKWLKKDDENRTIFKDEQNQEKMLALVDIYKKYQAELFRLGYFDFDDMIIDVITALRNQPSLRFELEEQFQYLLVDEFQDTNNAQMRILSLLTSSEVHEGKPNIMVVGDDDQAIYKFQGAELSNILDFRHRFKDVELVTMTENYRSTQEILDIAMKIIRKGDKRLENLIPDLSKELVANGQIEKGKIMYKIFDTALHEYKYVADTIKKLIDNGHSPQDIAVIGRKHANLEGLVPYMKLAGVPIKYEREQSVFAEPHIHEIIVIAKYLSSVVSAKSHEEVRDDLLPEILSFKFWGLERSDIWRISISANREKKTWLEIMQDSKNPKIKDIADFLIELSVDAKSEPLPIMIDKIVGAHIALSSDDQNDDSDFDKLAEGDGGGKNLKGDGKKEKQAKQKFSSPFREYYFSKERFSHARAEYLTFLSSLRVFINALRDFTGANSLINKDKDSYSILVLQDLVYFVDVYEKNKLKLNDKSPFVMAREAVELLSAHGSKGLEYKIVFILSCQDDVWASRGGGAKLSFPINLQIEPAGEEEDDQLRLFYVALTRAKESLYLTSHQVRDNGKAAVQLRFLVDLNIDNGEAVNIDEQNLVNVHELLETAGASFYGAKFLDKEEVLLHGILENYKLSVTHLNNFLNIPKGGPALFFEQNLLRFPQSKSTSGSYGSAIHWTLEFVLHHLKENNSMPQIESILNTFETFLKREKLHPQDFKLYLEKGRSSLQNFIEKKGQEFKASDMAEIDFAREEICISDINGKSFITGKIDKISREENGEISVHDYKTGKQFESFDEPNQNDAVKAHFYRNQLLFYKLLIENSSRIKQLIFARESGEVKYGIIDFIEPYGSSKKVLSVKTDLSDEDVDRLKRLSIVVYRRIKDLDFEIPKEIREQKFKNDLDMILAFEDFLLSN